MPLEVWASVTASPLSSLVPVVATLNGCVDALHARKVQASAIERIDMSPPSGTAVTVEDMRVARSWLADSLATGVDEYGRQAMVQRETSDRGWIGQPRLTSLVLALVLIAIRATATCAGR